ncbi:hypothetical protein D3C85_712570 [compost metagenome]
MLLFFGNWCSLEVIGETNKIYKQKKQLLVRAAFTFLAKRVINDEMQDFRLQMRLMQLF